MSSKGKEIHTIPWKVEVGIKTVKKVDFVRLPTPSPTLTYIKVPARVENIQLSHEEAVRLIGKYRHVVGGSKGVGGENAFKIAGTVGPESAYNTLHTLFHLLHFTFDSSVG